MELIKHSFDDLRGEHVRALFSTSRLAWSTSLVIFCYAALGLAYPLFNGFLSTYLEEKNANFGDTSLNATYSAYAYQAACGVPGSVLAAVLVNWSRGGRKFAMAFFTIMAGIFLFAVTQAKNQTQINALISIASFWENAFCRSTPRVPTFASWLTGRRCPVRIRPRGLPRKSRRPSRDAAEGQTPSRGTGDALASASSRVTGIFAPIIAVYAGTNPDAPVFVSASIFVLYVVGPRRRVAHLAGRVSSCWVYRSRLSDGPLFEAFSRD